MTDLASAFAQLLGRQPSEKEIEALYRVKNALNIRDNDSLWLVLMAFQSYDTLFSKYPAMISNHSEKVMADFRKAAADIADAETKKALGTLSEAVARTSETVAVQAVAASRYQFMGIAMIAMVAFGSLCTFVGYVLGTGNMPFWAVVNPGQHPFTAIVSAIARAPAGWVAAVCGCAAAGISMWTARYEIRQGKRLGLVAAGVCLAVISAAFLLPFL
ncbi:hypothetical protein DZC31_30160 (plasmid) [Stenotrophomonas rhizophila]|nr:hypothetical protein DZC31_30160 [Stenotrophomonas rhizophila]